MRILSLLSRFPDSWLVLDCGQKYLARTFSTEVTSTINFLMSQFGIYGRKDKRRQLVCSFRLEVLALRCLLVHIHSLVAISHVATSPGSPSCAVLPQAPRYNLKCLLCYAARRLRNKVLRENGTAALSGICRHDNNRSGFSLWQWINRVRRQ